MNAKEVLEFIKLAIKSRLVEFSIAAGMCVVVWKLGRFDSDIGWTPTDDACNAGLWSGVGMAPGLAIALVASNYLAATLKKKQTFLVAVGSVCLAGMLLAVGVSAIYRNQQSELIQSFPDVDAKGGRSRVVVPLAVAKELIAKGFDQAVDIRREIGSDPTFAQQSDRGCTFLSLIAFAQTFFFALTAYFSVILLLRLAMK